MRDDVGKAQVSAVATLQCVYSRCIAIAADQDNWRSKKDLFDMCTTSMKDVERACQAQSQSVADAAQKSIRQIGERLR
eukprot:9006005-Karenia_brevis.AAC.1